MQNRTQKESDFGMFSRDLLRLIFNHADIETTMAAYQSCGMFKDAIVPRCYRELEQQFKIPQEVINKLQSPVRLLFRLVKLGQADSSPLSRTNQERFIANCQNGDIDQLLQPWWFYPFKADLQQQFIEHLESRACTDAVKQIYLSEAVAVGNFELVKLLVEQYKVTNNLCQFLVFPLENAHTKMAVYLLEKGIGSGHENVREALEQGKAGSYPIYIGRDTYRYQAVISHKEESEGGGLKLKIESVSKAKKAPSCIVRKLQLVARFENLVPIGTTPDVESLALAIDAKRLDFVKRLIEEYKLVPNDVCFNKAVTCLDILEYLSENFPQLKALTQTLHEVAGKCSLRTAQILIKHGAEPDQATMNRATYYGGNIVLVDYLFKTYNLRHNNPQAGAYIDYLYERHHPSRVSTLVNTVRGVFGRLMP